MQRIEEPRNVEGFHRAIDNYHEMVRQSPYDQRLLTNLAWSYERAGEFPQAVQQFKQALDIDKSYIDAHYGLGLALLGNNQTQEAMRELETARELAAQSDDRGYMVIVQHQVDVLRRRYGGQ